MEHLASSRGGCANSKLKRPLSPLAFIALISGSQIQHVCFVCFADVRVRQSLLARPSKNRFAATHNSLDTALKAFIACIVTLSSYSIPRKINKSKIYSGLTPYEEDAAGIAAEHGSPNFVRPQDSRKIDLGRLLHPPKPLGHV